MEFLKEVLQIQHEQTLETLANTLLSRDEDKEELINKFNKPNYHLIKVSNTSMIIRNRVKIDKLISTL